MSFNLASLILRHPPLTILSRGRFGVNYGHVVVG
jgi:hypothetical protein